MLRVSSCPTFSKLKVMTSLFCSLHKDFWCLVRYFYTVCGNQRAAQPNIKVGSFEYFRFIFFLPSRQFMATSQTIKMFLCKLGQSTRDYTSQCERSRVRLESLNRRKKCSSIVEGHFGPRSLTRRNQVVALGN